MLYTLTASKFMIQISYWAWEPPDSHAQVFFRYLLKRRSPLLIGQILKAN